VDDLAPQRLLHVDQQILHAGDGVELGCTLQQSLLPVGAAPGQHVQPGGVGTEDLKGTHPLVSPLVQSGMCRRPDDERPP